MRTKKGLEGGGQKPAVDNDQHLLSATLANNSRLAKRNARGGHVTPVIHDQSGGAATRTPTSGEGQSSAASNAKAALPTPEPFSEREASSCVPQIGQSTIASCSTPTVEGVHFTGFRASQQNKSDNLDTLCDRLRELHRQRQDLHRAEKSLTLQIKAKTRRLCDGDKKEADKLYASMGNGMEHPLAMTAAAVSAPFIQARALICSERKSVEKQMEKAAKELPIAQWINDLPGVGMGSLAALVGECGNLSSYPTISKLWKRLGLGLVGDIRQQRKSGADGILHGYNPSRRSVSWNVASALFKRQSQIDGPYRKVYDARKEYETPRVETKAHAHNRAMRYMEKRFIRDLWRAWRDLSGDKSDMAVTPKVEIPHALESEGAYLHDGQRSHAGIDYRQRKIAVMQSIPDVEQS